MKQEYIKNIAASVGILGMIVVGNIAAQSMYARTGVSVDKKALTLSLLFGGASAALLAYGMKK